MRTRSPICVAALAAALMAPPPAMAQPSDPIARPGAEAARGSEATPLSGLEVVVKREPKPDPTPLSGIEVVAKPRATSTEVSELVVRAKKATALSDLTVIGHCTVPPESRWSDKMFDAPQDFENKRIEESPGTREIILKEITALRNNTRDYKDMALSLGKHAGLQLRFTRTQVVCRGAFKDIKFLHVTETGDDDFEVDFGNGPLEWEVGPLNARQVTERFHIRFLYPQPVTNQFQKLLNSMQQGWPDYADLTPDAAAEAQAQWPALQMALKDWGVLRSFYFLRQADDGSYLYAASFRNAEVIWKVAPLDGSGKMTGFQYDAPN
jgi:hypothetical protein